MQIIAIKQIKSGKNVYFITDEYNEYDLEKILELGERGGLENVRVISTKKDFGPLPEGEYIASFDKTLDYKNNTGLWDTFRWLWNYPAWGFVATPLEPSSKNQMYGRGNFYIHGGNSPGSKGCIDLVKSNQEFHCFMRLYKRNLKVIVRYK